jgi:hypothetical protein
MIPFSCRDVAIFSGFFSHIKLYPNLKDLFGLQYQRAACIYRTSQRVNRLAEPVLAFLGQGEPDIEMVIPQIIVADPWVVIDN